MGNKQGRKPRVSFKLKRKRISQQTHINKKIAEQRVDSEQLQNQQSQQNDESTTTTQAMGKSREEILEAKRKRERERYKIIKSDPELFKIRKERSSRRYIKKKIYVKIKERSMEEQEAVRGKWRQNSSKYYSKKKKQKEVQHVRNKDSPQQVQQPSSLSTKRKEEKTKKQEAQPGPSGGSGSSHAKTSSNVSDELDINTAPRDPPSHQRNRDLDQCRFCAGLSKNCVDVTEKDRPYLTRYKTSLTLNDLSVELDFNDDSSPKTVCRVCDRKLQEMYDFIKQVQEAQDLLNGVRDDVKTDIKTLIVKIECESPTPDDDEGDDNDNIDIKDKIIDSITVTETEFVKPIVNLKRKRVEVTAKTQKKLKVDKDVESANSEFMVMKKEKSDKLDDGNAYEVEKLPSIDSETETKPSEFDLATSNDNTDCGTLSLVKKSDCGNVVLYDLM